MFVDTPGRFSCPPSGSVRLVIVTRTTPKIRKAGVGDIPAIVAIHRDVVAKANAQVYPPNVIREWLEEISEENVKGQFGKTTWVAAEYKGQLVGFGQYSFDKGEIYQINVLPKFEREGYGRAIYNHIERDFIAHKIGKITLKSTLNAVDFYKKIGFRSAGKVEFKLGSTTVKMVRMENSIKRRCAVAR